MSQINPYASGYAAPTQPPAISYTGELAHPGIRLVGAIIDAIVMLPIAGVMLLVWTFGIAPFIGDGLIARIIYGLISALVGYVSFLAVHGYFLATSGQTIGKKLLKIQIVNENGLLLPFSELALKRYLPMWLIGVVPIVGPFLQIIECLFIFRENRKCIHDEIAGTKVIKIG